MQSDFFVSQKIQKICKFNLDVVLDGVSLQFDVPPQLVNSRTLVPVRAVAESLNINVRWDSDSNAVIISTSFAVYFKRYNFVAV